jgi:hypothetical protein
MAELSLETLDLSVLSAPELEQKRRGIVQTLTTNYKGYDDPTIPEELLHILAVITKTLRQKSSGPPRAPRNRTSVGKTISSDDL